MKLEQIYNELNKINEEELNSNKVSELLERINQAIIEESCLKTTPKSKISAIKRVFKNVKDRPIFQGWKRYEDYKVIVDGYEAFYLKNTDIPAKEVVEKIPEGANANDYIEGKFIDCKSIMPNGNKEEKLIINIPNILAAVKTKVNIAKLKTENNNEICVNPNYLKNVLDILGESTEFYYMGKIKPIYAYNENGEKAIVMPVRQQYCEENKIKVVEI